MSDGDADDGEQGLRRTWEKGVVLTATEIEGCDPAADWSRWIARGRAPVSTALASAPPAGFRSAAEAEDVSMTLSLVLQREPDFAALPLTVPARVTQALRVCLRKDPRQRAGDIHDVRLALEGAFDTTAPQTAIASAVIDDSQPYNVCMAF